MRVPQVEAWAPQQSTPRSSPCSARSGTLQRTAHAMGLLLKAAVPSKSGLRGSFGKTRDSEQGLSPLSCDMSCDIVAAMAETPRSQMDDFVDLARTAEDCESTAYGSERSTDTVSTVELICQAANLTPRAGKFTWQDVDDAVDRFRCDNELMNSSRAVRQIAASPAPSTEGRVSESPATLPGSVADDDAVSVEDQWASYRARKEARANKKRTLSSRYGDVLKLGGYLQKNC